MPNGGCGSTTNNEKRVEDLSPHCKGLIRFDPRQRWPPHASIFWRTWIRMLEASPTPVAGPRCLHGAWRQPSIVTDSTRSSCSCRAVPDERATAPPPGPGRRIVLETSRAATGIDGSRNVAGALRPVISAHNRDGQGALNAGLEAPLPKFEEHCARLQMRSLQKDSTAPNDADSGAGLQRRRDARDVESSCPESQRHGRA